MTTPAQRALVFGVVIAGTLGLLHLWGVGLKLLEALGLAFATLWLIVPRVAAHWIGNATRFVRARFWAPEQGRLHAFAGVALRVEDDERYVWVGSDGLRRAMGSRDSDEVLAARLSSHWRRSDDGALMLRVDAVVRHLATMPGRDEPRVQRLRRYFEREVLYPAGQRRARRAGRGSA